MSSDVSNRAGRRTLTAVVAIGLVMAGAAGSWVWMRSSGADADRAASAADSTPVAAASEDAPGQSLTEAAVSLTAEAVQRAGIRVSPVSFGVDAATVRAPGVVEPNAYRQVVVTPLVAGRVTRVAAGLGARVRQGQMLARIYSPEIAEAQARFLSARAMLDAHDRELARTERLVAIGAASRQELERVHAEHTAQTNDVRTARARLELLGVPTTAPDQGEALDNAATADVPAPIDGIVTERTANIGLNVDPAAKLFTVTDLSTVWIVAELYERDFNRVEVGARAEITLPSSPGKVIQGRVGYIDPQVAAATRTARVRVELPNPGQTLRLGMYVDVALSVSPGRAAGPAKQAAIVIPRSAVQAVGDRSVVYVEDPVDAARFIERPVRLGQAADDQVQVLEGLQPGDRIVVQGSFAVRAEIERLGVRRSRAVSPPQPEIAARGRGHG